MDNDFAYHALLNKQKCKSEHGNAGSNPSTRKAEEDRALCSNPDLSGLHRTDILFQDSHSYIVRPCKIGAHVINNELQWKMLKSKGF